MKTDLDEWIYLFKHAILPPNYQVKNLDKVGEKLNVLKMSPEQRHSYDLYLMAMVNEQDAIDTALNKGLQQGLQQGRDEGELKAKLEIAKKLLGTGMDIETVATMTGLSPNEIKGETL
jgi:predicted transposase/invertase (TIGR01784 family)